MARPTTPTPEVRSAPTCSAATGSPSPAPAARTCAPATRTCSPPRSTGSSPGTACRASASARSPPARCSSTARTSTSPARPCSGSALSAETPAYDVQQACATGLETVVSLSNKIRLGQLESAIAGGVDTTSDAPIAVSDRLRRALLDLSRAKTVGPEARGRRADPPEGPRARRPRAPASRARTCRWASTRRSPPRSGSITPGGAGRGRAGQPPAPRRRLRRRVLRRPGHPVPRPDARRQPARRLLAGEAGQAQAGVRARPGHPRDDDRRQLDAAVRRRLDGAARVRRVGRRARPGRRSPRWSTPRPARSTSCTGTTGCSWPPRSRCRACSPATG